MSRQALLSRALYSILTYCSHAESELWEWSVRSVGTAAWTKQRDHSLWALLNVVRISTQSVVGGDTPKDDIIASEIPGGPLVLCLCLFINGTGYKEQHLILYFAEHIIKGLEH